MRMLTHRVDEELDGAPLWRVLEERLHVSDIGIRRAKRIEGAIALDGAPSRTTATVHVGQRVSIAVDDATLGLLPHDTTGVEPQDGPIDLVYEDDDIAVVNKPAGLVVHPCSGQRDSTLGNFLVGHFHSRGIGCGLHPVHRLDQGTSGLITFATSGYVQSRLQEQIENGAFTREYLAVCTGAFPAERGTVDAPIGRVGYGPRSWDTCEAPTGRPAVTHWHVLDSWGSAEGTLSLVRLRLETGRTHQVRVHMAHLGCPLLGDAAYGKASNLVERAALHSWRLSCTHPITNAPLELQAEPPADLRALLPDHAE